MSGEYKDIVVEKATNKIIETRGGGNVKLLEKIYPEKGYKVLNTKFTKEQLKLLREKSKYLKYNNSVVELNKEQIDIDNAQQEKDSTDFEKQFDELLNAFALVVIDEINALRTELKLKTKSLDDLKIVVKAKVASEKLKKEVKK